MFRIGFNGSRVERMIWQQLDFGQGFSCMEVKQTICCGTNCIMSNQAELVVSLWMEKEGKELKMVSR